MMETRTQAFRTSSSKVISIPTRHDTKSNRHVVRWLDIKQYFENAKGIMNSEDAVLFLTDDNLEDLVPHRIAHHPGVVLEVLVGDNTEDYSGLSETFSFTSGGLDSPGQFSERPVSILASTQSAMTPVIRDDNDLRPMNVVELQDQLQVLQQQMQQIQQQLHEVTQKSDNSEQQAQHSIQRIQQREQQMQQMEKTIQKIQCSEQHTQQQLHQQLQQQVEDMLQKAHLQQGSTQPSLCQLNGEFSQKQLATLSRHIFIRDRIHALLSDSSLSVPRFFFILPKKSCAVHEDTAFRLYLLCECGSHTMSKDSKGSHEVHMTSHTGYEVKKPKEFIDKYGPYILTMMYMIKYGAMASGFIVSPLVVSSRVSQINQDLENPPTSNSDIEQLVDATITYLEDMTRPTGLHETSHWTLGYTDLEELMSYLEVDDDEYFPGDLHQLNTQHDNSWVCNKHQCEWTVRLLKDIIDAIGGFCNEKPGKIDINVAANKATEELYDTIIDYCNIQRTNDKPSLTLDCGQLSMTVGVYQSHQDVVTTINQLDGLTPKELIFIPQCNLTQFTINLTPTEADEDALIAILEQSPDLEYLYIGCLAERALAIVNLVTSVVESNEGLALRGFRLMDENLKPFSVHGAWDKLDHITALIEFSRNSKYVIDTSINLQSQKAVAEGDWMSTFFHHYGWSISSLSTAQRFSDHLATVLDKTTQIHGSKLSSLVLSPYSLTNVGLDAIDRVIKRSRNLLPLWLYVVGLSGESQLEKTTLTLERWGERLGTLSLGGDSIERWMPKILEAFSTKSTFPKLCELTVHSYNKSEYPHSCIQWLVNMVSTTLEMSGSISSKAKASRGTQVSQESSTTFTPLRRLRLSNITLSPQDWEILIKAMDFSFMQQLLFDKTNFSHEQLDLLLGRMAAIDATSLLLYSLTLTDTDLLTNADKAELRAKIRRVAPHMIIVGL
ncbi:hypothetical protein B0O80DRAFT_275071 [Mortierella sp. GBAus27b]|nr:hypothetical protein BGX31_005006 [Mortierella sp. GBA43]KAI8358144.1 hypothetical protein B0O80DRAFT_275071 [Mortierella sp. GBAus27b]